MSSHFRWLILVIVLERILHMGSDAARIQGRRRGGLRERERC